MRINPLEGRDVRPTSDRVKEAIFSIIQFDIEGRSILDLFAGSGQMGIETLSRGAEKAVFVDNGASSVKLIRENLEHTKLGGRASVVQTDCMSYLKMSGEKFDIAFLDPPYGKNILPAVLELLAPLMNSGGIMICECGHTEDLPEKAGNFSVQREYRYGKTKITTYRI